MGALQKKSKMAKNIHKLAKNYGARFIPTQEPLNQKIEELGYDAVTTDGIHLTQLGHQFLAETIREAVKKTRGARHHNITKQMRADVHIYATQ